MQPIIISKIFSEMAVEFLNYLKFEQTRLQDILKLIDCLYDVGFLTKEQLEEVKKYYAN